MLAQWLPRCIRRLEHIGLSQTRWHFYFEVFILICFWTLLFEIFKLCNSSYYSTTLKREKRSLRNNPAWRQFVNLAAENFTTGCTVVVGSVFGDTDIRFNLKCNSLLYEDITDLCYWSVTRIELWVRQNQLLEIIKVHLNPSTAQMSFILTITGLCGNSSSSLSMSSSSH